MNETSEKTSAVVPWDLFDYIGVAGFTGYPERYAAMANELALYGCKSAHWRFDFPNPFTNYLYNKVTKTRACLKRPAIFSLAYNHYANIKTAYGLGASRALFLEDDTAFLKDKAKLGKIMASVPPGADIALYGWRPSLCPDPSYLQRYASTIFAHPASEYWLDVANEPVFYSNMFELSRSGMERIIRNFEDDAFAEDGTNRGVDDFDVYFQPRFTAGLKVYAAYPLAACQRVVAGPVMHARDKPYKDLLCLQDFFDFQSTRETEAQETEAQETEALSEQPRCSICRTVRDEDCTPAELILSDSCQPTGVAEDNAPVDAVFVIGTGSRHDNEELRYALRNMAEHCKFVRNVYICGECPDWVDKASVIHLPWPDRFTHAKDANIVDKLRHACETPGIAKKVLFCSDDQFQTRECTWDDFRPRYLRRFTVDDPWYQVRNRTWHTRLRETLLRARARRTCLGLNPDRVFYYEPHMWMPMDRDKFIRYAEWSNYPHSTATIIASGYYNFVEQEPCRHFDHRFLKRDTPVSIVGTTTHVGYTDKSYDVAMSWLTSAFPHKSRFEK